MLKPSQLVYAAVLAVVATDAVRYRLKVVKHARMYLESHKIFEETERSQSAMIAHLCSIIDNAEIDVDEFDMIALNYYID